MVDDLLADAAGVTHLTVAFSCHDCPGKRISRSTMDPPRLTELFPGEDGRFVAGPWIGQDPGPGDIAPDGPPQPLHFGLQCDRTPGRELLVEGRRPSADREEPAQSSGTGAKRANASTAGTA